MSTHEGSSRIDRETAERLVRGGPDAWRTGHHRLAGLLAAAAAPARPGELAGREAALDAFRAATHDLVPQPRRGQMIKTWIAKILTVKVAAICVATAGVGGVGMAATTGHLPGPLNFADSPAPSSTTRPSVRPSGGPSHTPPPQALQKLCRDYLGKDHDHRGDALRDQAFHELLEHVGGEDRDKADHFCDKMLHELSSVTPTPGPSGMPGKFPSVKPTGLPTRFPTTQPTGQPGSKPTTWPGPSHL